jgi:hypothetical protein
MANKDEVRSAAALMGAHRVPRAFGGALDFRGARWLGQVAHARTLSLAELERRALDMERQAFTRGRLGALVVKRRGDPTEETPRLVVVTEATWRRFHARYTQSVLLSTAAEEGAHQ